MKTLQIQAAARADFGKKAAKACRREGQIPCILYGGGEEVAFTVDTKAVKPLIYTPLSRQYLSFQAFNFELAKYVSPECNAA